MERKSAYTRTINQRLRGRAGASPREPFVWNDLRCGLRGLRRNPGLAVVAVLTLALGIGVNSTIFSVAEGYFLRPLPGEDPTQLVRLFSRTPQGSAAFSSADFRDVESQCSAFVGVLAYARHAGFLFVRGDSRLIGVDVVSRNYFSVLGIRAIRGRTFSLAPVATSGPSIVLSYSLWQNGFGGDPELVGRNITLTGKTYTVVGIAPPSFRGLEQFVPTDAWIPLDVWYPAADLQSRSFRDFELVGRVATGATTTQARAQLVGASSRLASAYPATNTARTFDLVPASERLRGAIVITGLLLAVTGLVLLIACANVAGLLLAQSETRRREIAVRLALGAGRWRLLRQLLIENALLAAAGAGLAVLLAALLIRLQPALLPPSPIELGANLRIDTPVAIFTFIAASIAVLVFGAMPAMMASGINVVPALRSEGGLIGGRSGRHAMRNALVVGEVALSVVLMTGAALLLESLVRTTHASLGFDSHKHLLLADLAPGVAMQSAKQSSQYFEDVSRKIAPLPGVEGVSFALRAMLSGSGGGRSAPVAIPGLGFPQGQPTIDIKYNSVSPGYFRMVGTTILQGRTFQDSDGPNATKVAIIDEAMARRFWPHGNAIGRTIRVRGVPFQIVGIAEDAKINSIHEPFEPYMYFPFAQKPDGEGTLFVETALAPQTMAATIRRDIRAVNSAVPIIDLLTMDQLMRSALWDDLTATGLAAGLSVLGIFLAAVGLYGVIAYLVNGRSHEIGIRIALGAQSAEIFRMVVGHGLTLAAWGAAVGIIMALGAAQLMASLLYGVSPRDPVALGIACALALAVAVVASYFPARRATQVDPASALRAE